MSSAHPRIVLYERNGCHLCEEAAAVLDETLGTDGYARIDIDASDDLVVRYGFRVPVVAVDGQDRLEAPIRADELRRLLKAARTA
jgi:glutaredoxin